MAPWLPLSLALVGLLLLLPFIAMAAKRWRARARGGLALAVFLLGFGEVFDPPAVHRIEQTEDDLERKRAPGEPPL